MTELFAHRSPGFTIDLPPAWEILDDPQPGIPLMALEPDRGEGFRTNVVVSADAVEATSLADWQRDNDVLLPDSLNEYQLLDLERIQLDGHAGARRLAHHVVDGRPVCLEQWAVLRDGIGYTVTVTVETLRYTSLIDDLTRSALSFRLTDAEAGAAR